MVVCQSSPPWSHSFVANVKDSKGQLHQTLWLGRRSSEFAELKRPFELSAPDGARSELSAGPVVSRSEEKEKIMPLMQIVIALIVVGVLLWLVNAFIPMAGSIKSILNAVVVIAVVLWLLNVFGLFHSLSHIRIGT